MYNLNGNKKKNSVTIATVVFLLLATVLVVAGISAPLTALASRSGIGDGEFIDPATNLRSARAPGVVSGDNIYIAWWTNNTENAMKK